MSYGSMKLPELKEELKKRGLPVSGKKDELVTRLQAHDSDKGKDKDDDIDKGKGKANQEEAEKEAEHQEAVQEDGKKEDSKSDKKGKRKLDEDEPATEKNKKGRTEDSNGEGILKYLKDEEWSKALGPEFSKPYFKSILKFLESEKADGKQIFPPEHEIFSALNYTPLDKVKVVILGQDPYHDDNQAEGLCFSVKKGITPPPSLKNMFKELVTDVPGFKIPQSGSLVKWAERGVLLLNATLTVEAHKANSHAQCGWMTFTDAIIKTLNQKTTGLVFILWGGFAQKKGKIIDAKKHHVIQAAHPSPLSCKKFFGCKVFSKTNELLEKDGKDPIDWTLI